MPEVDNSKYLVNMDWSEVPHLSKEEKDKIWAATQPHLREARSRGIPSLGAGAIYPIPESDIMIDPFEIPRHFPRVYAMDVGWNRTAALWGAIDLGGEFTNRHRNDPYSRLTAADYDDPGSDPGSPNAGTTVYLYAEYYRSQAEPTIHATGIKAKGDWIPGVIDPASAGSNQKDGSQLIEEYRDLGLDLIPADNAVEAGIQKVWEWLSTGRIKAFSTLRSFFMEYRLYRRDENGKIVKKNDHLMDDLRYLIMSGLDYAITKPPKQSLRRSTSHRDANPYTGY